VSRYVKSEFKFVPANQYYLDLLAGFNQAKSEIIICSMTIDYGPKINQLFDAIKAALKRKVNVEIIIDKYSLSYMGEHSFKLINKRQRIINELNTLKDLGASVNIIGKVGLNPFAHRMHIKTTIIDGTTYSFGGINFNEESFSHNDYTLQTTNSAINSHLKDILANVVSSCNYLDKEYIIKDNLSILVDSGKPNHSIIYERACNLAREAKEVTVVSKMCPSGELGLILSKVPGYFYYNKALNSSFPSSLAVLNDQLIYKLKNSYKDSTYLHAKFILFDLKDGTRCLLSGSHNFNWRGVKFGTKEICLYSTDQKLWNQLAQFTRSL